MAKKVTVFKCPTCGNVAANLPDWCICPTCGAVMEFLEVVEVELSQTMKRLEVEQ
jgi:hypothetical protein